MDMTKEKLVVENLRLAGYMAKKFLNTGVEWDELLSLCYLGLVEAATRFDPERGKFVTIACLMMKHHVLVEMRKRKKRILTVSFDAPIPGCEDLHIEDLLSYEEQGFKRIEQEDLLNGICILPEKEKHCILLWLGNARQTEIARQVGVTQSYVSQMIKSGARKLKDYL